MVHRLVFCLLLLFLFLTFSVRASELRLMPRVFMSEEYTDNLYLAPTGEKSDWITVLGPGISLKQVTQYRSLGVDYELGITRYKREDRNDSTRQTLTIFWDEQLRERLFMNISEIFYRTEQPSEFRYQPDILAVRRTRKPSYRNTVSGRLSYQFAEKGFLDLHYSDNRFGSDDPAVEDSLQYSPGFGLRYGWGPRHEAGLDLTWSRYEYDTKPGQESWSPSFSYTYRLNPHTSVGLQYSYTTMDFKSSAQNDYETHSFSLSYNQSPTETLSYSLSLGYYLRDTEESGQDSSLTYTFNLNRRFEHYNVSLSGASGYRGQYVDAENRGFTQYRRFSASISAELGPYITGQASAYYSTQEYKDINDRTDDFYGFSCSIKRMLNPKINVSLSYSYRIRDAEQSSEEYRENSLILRINLSHEIRR
ncbi:outer membrane beta-barrel protein [Thermosulfuriphilus ammonigenes]|uniref:Outer membrane beta-barrel protein n=1 Tax=Thermosulfuriphilus ammonigenes TaxID=1936021 RepID=A0A6G7PUE0_9BACT|nr:outer membrane beta-barrel protein [Thermosulfuriphilus ammonigenes]MBA2848553.1 hypothetical protein [Thermosulfuriphilus ammonigenes]QIJ71304.1 outer membrane beta-barrel protein [Thermosulfuriphilus ammonigenes]